MIDDPITAAAALLEVAEEIRRLGNGSAMTGLGAIEGLAMMIERAGETIGHGLDNVADAIRETTAP